MALEFLKLADKKLAQSYNAKPAKPAKDPMPGRRTKVLENINKALAHINAKTDNPKRGHFSTKGGVTRITVRYGNKPLVIEGQSEFFVPWERAKDFYTQAAKAVEAKELDAAITAAAEGKGRKGTSSGGGRIKEGWNHIQSHLSNIRRKDRGPEFAERILKEKVNKGQLTQAKADEARAAAKAEFGSRK